MMSNNELAMHLSRYLVQEFGLEGEYHNMRSLAEAIGDRADHFSLMSVNAYIEDNSELGTQCFADSYALNAFLGFVNAFIDRENAPSSR